jgi:hypothetical protein
MVAKSRDCVAAPPSHSLWPSHLVVAAAAAAAVAAAVAAGINQSQLLQMFIQH